MESVGDGFTWRKQNSSVEIDEDTLDDRMRERIAAGAQNLRADAFVKVSDAHLEAKARFFFFDSLASRGSPPECETERPCAREVFPCAHPYGTGSFASEQGTYIPPQRVCRNRLLSLQSFFRRSSRYCFWQLDMTIKRNLFLFNQHRVRSNLKSGASSEDKFTQVFGSIIPRQIPESTAWWKVVFICFLRVSHSAARTRRRAEISKPFATTRSQVGTIVLRCQCLELRTCVFCDAMEPRASFSIRSVDVSLVILCVMFPPCLRPLAVTLCLAYSSMRGCLCAHRAKASCRKWSRSPTTTGVPRCSQLCAADHLRAARRRSELSFS